jgi:hypothetical protein
MAIAAQKLLPQKTGGAMVPINKSAITKITPIGVKKPADANPAEGEEKDTLVVIKERCIEIDTLLKGSLALDKIRADQLRKKSEKKERTEGEKELEKSDNKDEKKGKGLKLPKISFFDRIKNFIKNVILGFIVTRLIKFAPQIAKVLSFLAPIGKFIFAVGAKLLEGFVNLVDFGYKIYDSGRKFIGDKLGDEALANFDKLSGAINTMLNLALIAAMATMGGRQRGPRRPKRPRRPRRFDPKKVRDRARNIQKLRRQRRMQRVAQRLAPVVDAGRSVAQRGRTAVTNVVQSKPVQNLARRGGGLFDRIANNSFVKGATDFGKSIYKGAVGTTNFIGGLGKKFGSSITNAYDGMKDLAKKKYDDIIKAKDFLANKFKQGTQALGNATKGLADKAKEQFVKKILEPLQPILKPLTEKVRSLGKKFGDLLKKIPGFDKVDGVLKKIGAGSTEGIAKKLGAKAIPILGGIVNLLFAYDRIAQGDTFGGLLEGISGAFDLAGLVPGLQWGPGVSMAIDTYMLARDFIPQIQEGEEAVIGAVGLGGLKNSMDNMAKKLPDLSTIAKFIVGGDPNKPLVGNKTEKGETSGTTKSNLGSTPNTNTNTASASRMGNFDVEASNDITKVGKDLISQGFSVAEHPDFTKTPTASGGSYTPGKGNVSNVHSGAGHYESRAIDVTDWRGTLEDSKARYRSVLDSVYNNGNMAKDMLLIHDSWGAADKSGKNAPGSHAHPTHMHIEVKDRGGFIGKGLFKNMGGVEFVLDHDTTKALEKTLPGFLNAINKADGKSVMKVLEQYASYDMPEMIPVPIPQPIQNAASDAYGKAKSAVTNVIVKSKEAFSDILYMR